MPKSFYILLFLPFLTGCFKADLVFEDQFEPVVEAYLYVDKEVNNIKLSSMISFSSDSSGGENITDAFISLEGENLVWNLLHDDSNPGSYYLDESPVFTPGDTIVLKVELEDELLTAQTVIP
ncbi:MAG: DUF4249 family protein, partial [Bacteroides sp.]|nr:DUF4249 family protein [Bacteroides sp.]